MTFLLLLKTFSSQSKSEIEFSCLAEKIRFSLIFVEQLPLKAGRPLTS